MKNKLLIPAIIFGVLIILNSNSYGQEALKPRPSPLSVTTMKFEDTYVKITYSRPHKRGRETFGSELAPFGEVWRTGANEATEITLTGDIKLNGHKIKAGTYSIFTIPQKEKWTVIINKGLGQWGTYDYDKSLDLVRFEVPVEMTEIIFEPFTISFEEKNKDNVLSMQWDKTKVSIPLEF
ncbi:DUF2911 domain-containing protein [Xanthovirga aplysinae]|uniref:DUF2911 domain-containing protein n=1 Tax=Xanthovirga aplysinae TaxID=2529853 RepID=UPI0012BB82EE|nr:DUF2911 domain-containing protein [Xanthovirga aplysinae]MTI30326.1 DUF2911 domain-containing protein [Xanthovirga aplysinae]